MTLNLREQCIVKGLCIRVCSLYANMLNTAFLYQASEQMLCSGDMQPYSSNSEHMIDTGKYQWYLCIHPEMVLSIELG